MDRLPLLRKMAQDAPGSWEHSRAMANLAEAAAASIQADALLTRTGAYYHDLGKSIQAKYYIENLSPGERSPHEELEPDVSADAIMAHVIEGTRILREGGLPVVFGNAAQQEVLRAAGIMRAKMIIVTSPDAQDAQAILATARSANSRIDSVIRVHSLLLRPQMLKAGAGAVVVAEHELAYTVCEMALQRLGVGADAVAEAVERLRRMERDS